MEDPATPTSRLLDSISVDRKRVYASRREGTNDLIRHAESSRRAVVVEVTFIAAVCAALIFVPGPRPGKAVVRDAFATGATCIAAALTIVPWFVWRHL